MRSAISQSVSPSAGQPGGGPTGQTVRRDAARWRAGTSVRRAGPRPCYSRVCGGGLL